MENIILSFLGSVIPAILFNTNKKNLFWAGIAGIISWMTYLFIDNKFHNTILATFVGAFVMGIFSEAIAIIIKTPSSIFSVPGSVPLVPGFSAYLTAKQIMENNYPLAIDKGVETIASGGAIALGVLISMALFREAKTLFKKEIKEHD